ANRRVFGSCRRSCFKADNIRIIPPCSYSAVKYSAGAAAAVIAFMMSAELIGATNFIRFYEPADPSDPAAVTVRGITVSLLSGENNLINALGEDYQSGGGGCCVWGILVREPVGYDPLGAYQKTDHEIYHLDIFGNDPDKSRIYNGVNSRSAPEEVKAAFGSDCIITDNVYTEIFIDGREADYGRISLPDEDEEPDDWFERICGEYPCRESCIVLECTSYSGFTDITYTVWENTRSE
ncbi:MAG: hypothetical protein NC120_12715, partial [Ruminococcus sp.]|nr:hypothetical protein [Ruminococcus sp.]